MMVYVEALLETSDRSWALCASSVAWTEYVWSWHMYIQGSQR